MNIHPVDLTIVVVYLLGITAIGVISSRRQTKSSAGYFLAGRSLSWVTVGLALFATNISTVHLIGLSSAGFNDGLVVGNFEWLAPFCLILLGLVFAPFYFRSKVATLPEYLEGRYGPGSRTVLAFMAVVGALFIHIGVTLYAGAVVVGEFVRFQTPTWYEPLTPLVDFNIAAAISLISLLTVIYTVTGGLKAVVVTESIQTVLLLLGAITVTAFAMLKLADQGTTSLAKLHQRALTQQISDAETTAEQLRLTAEAFQNADSLRRQGRFDAADLALAERIDRLKKTLTFGAVSVAVDDFPEIKTALTILVDNHAGRPPVDRRVEFGQAAEALREVAQSQENHTQECRQSLNSDRPRSSKLNMIRHEGRYTWWIMLLGYPVIGIWYWCADQTIVQRVLGARSERDAQIGPIFAGFIKVLPVLVMVLPGVMGYVLFRDRIGDNPDSTLIVLIKELLPCGLQGLVVAGLLAALMSTVAGALNSTATLVSFDIVKRLRPNTSDRVLVRIGQATVVVVMLSAIVWSTQGERFGGIFSGINHMISVLAPPITTVFIWGIFWRRGTSQASMTTLIAGFLLGLVVFVADFPAFGFEIVSKRFGMPFMLQAWWLFVICSVVFVVASLLTPVPDPRRVEGYCWNNPLAAITNKPFSGPLDPRVLSIVLVVVMLVLYAIFG